MSRSSKPRSHSGRSGARREELRRTLPKPTLGARALIQRPDFVGAVILLVAVTIVGGLLVGWSRDRAKVSIGQVMTETRLNRVDYRIEDSAATDAQRDAAREAAPRVYRLNQTFLDNLRADLNSLPVIVEGKTTLDGIVEDTRTQYALQPEALAELQKYVTEGRPTGAWQGWVTNLVDTQLLTSPLIAGLEYQNFLKSTNRLLVRDDGREKELRPQAIEIVTGSGEAPVRIRHLVQDAGFPPAIAPYIQARLTVDVQDTIQYAAGMTEQRGAAAAAAVEPVVIEHKRGEIIYRRGDRLTPLQYQELIDEAAAWRADAPIAYRWLRQVGLLGVIGVLLAFVGTFVMMSYPRIQRNPLRVVAICLLMIVMLAITCVTAASLPQVLILAAIGPTLFVATILLLSYDRRLAIFLSTVQCALVALALNHGVGWFVLLMAGCGTMIVQLPEVRHRNSLISASVVTAIALGFATIMLGLFTAPPVDGVWLDVLTSAGWASAAALSVGFVVLGMLPTIEKLFDITTGMTLAELRDPSQPLLRQLQQRAPGTYNHSLQVASIAEAAADAIGADSLLVYVGAMYHDIGKMNKPQYFVENQARGFNKHENLRPAMSLLVIIGHVKDGIELAREYSLPRAIQHFIESHHGTTLVEYFYHAAKEEAESGGTRVDEIEFRYPGPRPRTREAAIMMLSDAVESATRALAEPNPSRIESVVREISRKRLLDGQFDECDLTFRELGLIEDAVIARLCAIHHGRIAYPKAKSEEKSDDTTTTNATTDDATTATETPERKSRGA